jgi:hypothetical protein
VGVACLPFKFVLIFLSAILTTELADSLDFNGWPSGARCKYC